MNNEIRQLATEEFPELLKEINDPPKKLYIKGELPPAGMKYLCVVGSRKYSPYGKEACKTLIEGLRGYPIVIVSGLALGIDSIAHETALDVGLRTIALPGSGLGDDALYPRTNKNLAKRILDEGGALLSEFEENFKATLYSFPQRNRVMAGMSNAVFIIEAQERSGTLITSKFATEYNRDVLTVPASIFSGHSYGPHMLIKNGATPITKSEDILEVFGLEKEVVSKRLLQNLGENEKRVLEFLLHPMPRDELLQALNLPIKDANVLLSSMELKGLIVERLGELRQA